MPRRGERQGEEYTGPVARDDMTAGGVQDLRGRLLRDLAIDGARRCPACGGDPELWIKGFCHCTPVTALWSVAEEPRTAEQTGCREIRALYRVLVFEEARDAFRR